jgi:hypothetical protein
MSPKTEYLPSREPILLSEKFELCKDNGLFIGLFLAEGNVDIESGYVQITNNANNIRDFVKNWFDKYGMKYWRRNCTFEPYKNLGSEVENCIKEMEIAFRWNKPAVINSHRINFTSRITTKLRDKTLSDLEVLIIKILKKWPDVEFVNSSELANHICK